MWPNMKLLLDKIRACYDDYQAGNDISGYETQLGLHKEEIEYNGSLERISMNRGL